MINSMFITVLVLAVVGCGTGASQDVAASADGTTPASKGTAAASAAVATDRTLPNGTRVNATIQNALSSRTNKPGETFLAYTNGDVSDAKGRVIIPSGSPVSLRIDQLEPGSDQVRPDGRINLAVVSVSVNGQTYPIEATLDAVAHHMQGRGITTDEAARLGAGTAIGAAVGQAIGKNTKSTVIGGAVGAVAGGAVAARYALRDIIVTAGTPISFALAQSLHLSAR
jgi:hypothetical protein